MLALAGCSRSSKDQPEPSPTANAPVEDIASDMPSPEPSSTQAAVPQDAIPPALLGRWGLVKADCTSQAGDAKGLLTVSSTRLQFYESVADLTHVTIAKADAFTGDFNFSGEGQSWKLQVALHTPDGGLTMIRKDTGPDAMPQALTYSKCP